MCVDRNEVPGSRSSLRCSQKIAVLASDSKPQTLRECILCMCFCCCDDAEGGFGDVSCGELFCGATRMPFTRRPLQTTITFVALNGLLCLSLGPVYDFVCDLPYWERRRERLRQERAILGAGASQGVLPSEHN